MLCATLRTLENCTAVVSTEARVTEATPQVRVADALVETIFGARLCVWRLAPVPFPPEIAEALAELTAPVAVTVVRTDKRALRELAAILAAKASNAHAGAVDADSALRAVHGAFLLFLAFLPRPGRVAEATSQLAIAVPGTSRREFHGRILRRECERHCHRPRVRFGVGEDAQLPMIARCSTGCGGSNHVALHPHGGSHVAARQAMSEVTTRCGCHAQVTSL